MEIRFVSEMSWAVIPGELNRLIKSKYTVMENLPLLQLPEEIRKKEPKLLHKPLHRFSSERFLLQLGPRVVSLITKSNDYPGWGEIRSELSWFINVIEEVGFITEGERLGLRYIDFFNVDLFGKLKLETRIEGNLLHESELQFTTVFPVEEFTTRLNINNRATITSDGSPERGSVFDLDIWTGANSFNLFQDGLEKFDKAHDFNKKIFFGLLKPEFLDSLNPEY